MSASNKTLPKHVNFSAVFKKHKPCIFRATLGEADAFVNHPAHLDSTRASIAKYSKLPPQTTASTPLANNYETHAKPESIGFWIDTMHERGLIKGKPDLASIIEP